MPRLTILMPVHSAERTLGAAISSTLRDLPRDARIAVLDDGSLDASATVARSFDDPRVQVRTRRNGGVASALNELLDSTDSEFVARMDADDIVLPGRFRRQLRALTRRRDGTPAPDAVFTTVVQFGDGARPVPRPSRIPADDFSMHLLLTNPVAHPTLMARRAALERAGGYRQVPTEDYDLWLRLAADDARLERLRLPGLAYRMHPGQVTASAQWRHASWGDPTIGEAYSQLSELLLGAPSRRITTLAVDDSLDADGKREEFSRFAARFIEAASRRPTPSEHALRRKLSERARWLEERLAQETVRAAS
ncbi:MULTISPECIES: glycosyltransferase family 2 protein [Brachybacterium]|uniref:glycosyltransferase family 2 protein n=1 Tax=Brachybacterium TaxID=43668 RepID=UPI00105C714B|nr:glycosyltransferase [Brachybacterium sp. AG952]TDP77907.1 glycosyl transferase family 2 [Brachybacterium sp. AG952]